MHGTLSEKLWEQIFGVTLKLVKWRIHPDTVVRGLWRALNVWAFANGQLYLLVCQVHVLDTSPSKKVVSNEGCIFRPPQL